MECCDAASFVQDDSLTQEQRQVVAIFSQEDKNASQFASRAVVAHRSKPAIPEKITRLRSIESLTPRMHNVTQTPHPADSAKMAEGWPYWSILVVDDEPGMRNFLVKTLGSPTAHREAETAKAHRG